MAKTNHTIYDVAQAAQVSIATVSRVLNSPEKVSPETLETVRAAIERLRFVPKADARARALKENRRVGVITPYLTAPSFVQRLRGVAEGLKNSRYELVIYSVDNELSLNRYLENFSVTQYLDGLIILSLQVNDERANWLVKHQLESVLVEYPTPVLNSIEIDDMDGGRMAAQFLVEHGHRHLGFMGDTDLPEFGIHPITQRLKGFLQGLEAQNIHLARENIIRAPYDMAATRRLARNFLKRSDHPSAIFAATDVQGVAILWAARDVGLRVPQDVAVIGFDNLDLADYVGLTTIDQHLDESGRVAVELLVSRIFNPNRAVQHIQLPLKIVERETV